LGSSGVRINAATARTTEHSGMPSRPHLITRLVVAWCGLVWFLILAVAVYVLASGYSLTSPPLVILFGIFIVFSILAVRTATRLFACLALTTLVVPVYLFESYLRFEAYLETTSHSNLAHVAKLRQQGLAAYPAVFPSGFLDLWQKAGEESRSPIVIEDREILPLAGIPNVLTSYCRAHDRDRSWVTYHSDSFGFRNPVVGRAEGNPEFALLGDSFAQGYCVHDAFTYAAQISVLGPTTSYGMNGTSALTQLAIYREYVKPLRPRHIIWFFYEGNDLTDYLAERAWPLLRAYLDSGHVQNLVTMNGSISVALKRLIDQQLASEDVATLAHDQDAARNSPDDLLDFLLLQQTGDVLRRVGQPRDPFTMPTLPEPQWLEISHIWREVIETQRGQGGQITFVYIPAHWRFLAQDQAPFQALERKVVTLWSGLGVDYVSLTGPLEATGNPLAYYRGLHFNEQGYRLTAETIIEHLRRSAGG
jgi:hypothetical protein